jgi:hypothetical protein
VSGSLIKSAGMATMNEPSRPGCRNSSQAGAAQPHIFIVQPGLMACGREVARLQPFEGVNVCGRDWVAGGRRRRALAVGPRPRGVKRNLVVALSVIGCVAWLAFAISGVAAASSPKSYKTRISFERSGSKIVGRLASPKAACLKKRLVYGVYSSPKFAGGNLGPVHSDGHGHFSLSLAAVPPGSWKVRVLTSPKTLSAHSSCAEASKATTLAI